MSCYALTKHLHVMRSPFPHTSGGKKSHKPPALFFLSHSEYERIAFYAFSVSLFSFRCVYSADFLVFVFSLVYDKQGFLIKPDGRL